MIEQDRSHSLIIAATNHPLILDVALFRRFDDILQYELPEKTHIVKLLKARLAGVAAKETRWDCLGACSTGLSHAEIVRAAEEVLKDALIHERPEIHESDIRAMLDERMNIAGKLEDKRL